MREKTEDKFIEALMHFGASDLNEEILQVVSLDHLLRWSMDEENPRLCFRSSWAMEHILLKNPEHFNAIYKRLITNYQNLNNWSSLRSYTKLLMWLLSKSNTSITLSEKEKEIILEKSFAIIDLNDCPVAVKVNAFDILFRLIPTYEWVAKELKLIIELHLEKENTPALKSRDTYILNRLAKWD
ncbi:hypothetical protein [Sphingobacterium sp.]|uniref:hypothetical protein n=1 Tax=Sphingobacterium sp. TaxID=341027 RepID=UPI0028A81FE9|nr:hypothetical protein [Sphingobacterium sp.]